MAQNRVEGLDAVMGELNRQIGEIKGATVSGLLEGGLLIQRRSMQKVPVDTGNLRGSAYTRKAQDDPMAVEIGYEAEYAAEVHEDLEVGHAVGEAKYLERATSESTQDVLKIVTAKAKRGG